MKYEVTKTENQLFMKNPTKCILYCRNFELSLMQNNKHGARSTCNFIIAKTNGTEEI